MRKTLLKRGSSLKRKTPMKKRNAKRGGKRFPKGYDPKYRAYVRGFPCILARRHRMTEAGGITHVCDGPVVFMHVRTDGSGHGDRGNGLPGCQWGAHEPQHRIGLSTWAAKYGLSVDDLKLEAAKYAITYERETSLQQERRPE